MDQTTHILCRCGQVEFELSGKPMVSVVCHCDDCQRASAELEKLPGAVSILDEAGGTPYVMYLRHRVNLVKGSERLVDHRIEGEADTRRVVASCCQTPLFLDYEKGFWQSFFHARFAVRPRLQFRNQTRFVPAGTTLPRDIPASKTYPLGFIARLIVASFGAKKK